jgi:acyl carrier protein
MTEQLSFSQFVSYIFQELEVPTPVGIDRENLLAGDLELDSIQVFEMICIVEDFGVEIPDEALFNMASIGDLYDEYTKFLALST